MPSAYYIISYSLYVGKYRRQEVAAGYYNGNNSGGQTIQGDFNLSAAATAAAAVDN